MEGCGRSFVSRRVTAESRSRLAGRRTYGGGAMLESYSWPHWRWRSRLPFSADHRVGSRLGESVKPTTPVTFVGNISCNLQGTITISPGWEPKTNTGPWVVTFTGTKTGGVGLPYTSSTGTM